MGDKKWVWVRDYADISPCIELMAVYDDTLKKDCHFTSYAVRVAQEIVDRYGLKCKVTWGKWGARLETGENNNLTDSTLEEFAETITSDSSWTALKETTRIFTFGKEGGL